MSFENDEYLAGQAMEAHNYSEAVRLLRPLAERNSQYALLTLGWIYESGATGSPDKDAARALYEQAAISGSAAAYRYLGRLLVRDGQEAAAISAFERGAHLNDEECKAALARFRFNAEEKAAWQAFQEGNYEEAVRLLKPLAERNSGYALCNLGYISELGLAGTPDKQAALAYYKRAAAQGDGDANFRLGRLLSEEGDAIQARAAFQAGAELAHVASMSRLGRMMVHGGAADRHTGVGWLEKAAAKGDLLARRELLMIQARSESILNRLSIRMKIAALSIKWAKQMSKHPHGPQWLRSRTRSKANRSSSVWKRLLRLPPIR